MATYQAELATIQRRLEAQQSEGNQLRETLALYQARVESTPARESELTELMRDYETLENNYTSLLQNSEESKVALNLERRQIGEQFRMIDAPRLPERPVSPNRLSLTLLAALAGLGFGVGLTALIEYRDTSLRTHEDVVTALSLPVLAIVPAMTSRREKRHQRTVRWVAWGVALLALIGVAAFAWRLELVQRLLLRLVW